MDKVGKLTEKLKVLENQVSDTEMDLRSINLKLETAYQYEEDLAIRQAAAKKKTDELRIEFFKKSGKIGELYQDMKNILDVFTGNFYRS